MANINIFFSSFILLLLKMLNINSIFSSDELLPHLIPGQSKNKKKIVFNLIKTSPFNRKISRLINKYPVLVD